MSTVEELQEQIDEQGYEIEALNDQVSNLEWAQEDAQALAHEVRRTHDGDHSTPWMWCPEQSCRLVREHELG